MAGFTPSDIASPLPVEISFPPVQVATPARMTYHNKPFRFLDLPVELRLIVYKHLVVVGKVFYTPSWLEKREGSRFMDMDEYAVPPLAILRVNKQIHSEAEPVYLSKNLFVLPQHWEKRKPFVEDIPEGAVDRHLFSSKAMIHVQNISVAFSSLPSAAPYTNMSSDWTGESNRQYDYDSMTPAQRLKEAHVEAMDRLSVSWREMYNAIDEQLSGQLGYLEVDFTNAYCPVGCCRMTTTAYCCCSFYTDKLKTVTMLGLRNINEEMKMLGRIRYIHLYLNKNGSYARRMKKAPRVSFGADEDPWAAWKVAVKTEQNE